MLCNVILSFVLVFSDGHTEKRVKWVDHSTAETIVLLLNDKQWLNNVDPPSCCSKATNVTIEEVEQFDCEKGPVETA